MNKINTAIHWLRSGFGGRLSLGFTPGESNSASELVIGAVFQNRLQFAGIVRDGVTENVTTVDVQRLGALLQQKPSVPYPTPTSQMFWVRPAVICDVKCRGIDNTGLLLGSVLDRIRPEP